MAYSGNGTGTQADPYQVTTIEQLVECFAIYNSISAGRDASIYIYCKLMNDLDFNNSPQYWDCPAGLFAAANNTQTEYYNHVIYIDGNNFGIYNMYVFNKPGIFTTRTILYTYGNSISISNCVIEAVVINSTGDRTNLAYNDIVYNSGIFFSNCDLRIKLYRYSGVTEFSSLFKFTKFDNCILNIDIVINRQGFSSNTDSRAAILHSNQGIDNSNNFRNFYNEWNIRIIIVAAYDMIEDGTASLFDYTCHFFSSFFIEMIAVQDSFTDKIKFTSDSHETYINNCYFVVKNTNTTYNSRLLLNNKVIKNGVNFYDSQLANGQLRDVSSGDGELLALTTAQCKDAEYLEQHGFIIAR